jgi:hypothetical protein
LTSHRIKELLTEYIEENMSKKDFPKEIRVNLARIIELTQINIGEIKDSLKESLSLEDLKDTKFVKY